MKHRITITLGIIFSILLIGGVAYASIPDAGGVIHGCYKTSDGKLRVVESICASGETALDWNQTGLQGAQGIQGPAGTNGSNGVSGWEWVRGLDTMASCNPLSFCQAITYCPSGKKPLGGGYNSDHLMPVNTNFPYIAGPGGDGWYAEAYNEDPVNIRYLSVWVICAEVN